MISGVDHGFAGGKHTVLDFWPLPPVCQVEGISKLEAEQECGSRGVQRAIWMEPRLPHLL